MANGDARTPDSGAAEAQDAVSVALARFREVRSTLARLTGGAPASLVLAELAQQVGWELAASFDDLPMHQFAGRIARIPGLLGAVTPGRRVLHRVVLGRYLSASPPIRGGGEGYDLRLADIGLVALGRDGVLRAGHGIERVRLPKGTPVPDEPLAWDDLRLRRVPSLTTWLARWPEAPVRVATPAQVLDALATVAATITDAARRDLDLLQRLLPPE